MPPIIVLSVDSLRFDRFSPRCFPESYALFDEEFASFTNCLSHGVATPFAFPGIVAGTVPGGDCSLPTETPTLAERLDGRRSIAFTNNGHLRPDRGYDRGFPSFDWAKPPNGFHPVRRLNEGDVLRTLPLLPTLYHRLIGLYRDTDNYTGSGAYPLPYEPAEAVTEFVMDTVTDRDTFLWAHYMDPHTPYHPDSTVGFDASSYSYDELWELNDRVTEGRRDKLSDDEFRLAEELYDANVRYLDRELARLLRWMRDRPWYEDAFVVVVADHGECLGEHGLTFHPWDAAPYDALIHTPLLLKYPGGTHAGESYDHLTCHADIVSTILSATDGTAPDTSNRLTRVGERRVVSVSNTTVRVTEPSGHVVKRRNGALETTGSVSAETRSLADERPIPSCQSMSGDRPGVDTDAIEDRLAALGYR